MTESCIQTAITCQEVRVLEFLQLVFMYVLTYHICAARLDTLTVVILHVSIASWMMYTNVQGPEIDSYNHYHTSLLDKQKLFHQQLLHYCTFSSVMVK